MPWNKIPLVWLQEVPKDEQAGFEETLRNSTYVLNKLKAIIQREVDALELDKEDDYKNPMWPVLRADRNGRQKALRYIYKLLP